MVGSTLGFACFDQFLLGLSVFLEISKQGHKSWSYFKKGHAFQNLSN